ncbi:MAG TPA: HlyD family efflux transporter periplasmic adaptor subunit [Anaeromyxobacter sp.]|nr:HlyD family efflux transporter periplasmic adaptor subunit [Anaeromyxobacter sp.]
MADRSQGQDEAVGPAERPGPDTWGAEQILEAMPSLVTRGIVYVSVLLLGTAVAYASFTQLDITVACPAVVQPGQVNRLAAPEGGVVERVMVGPGQHVGKGEPLLLIRPAAWVEGTPATPLTADADGVVLELPVGDRGVSVAKGDLLCTLYPDEVGLRVELKLPNKEVGRVQAGMPVSLRLDAYPVAEFGVVGSEVVRVSAVARADSQLGWVYPVIVALPRPWVEAHGKRLPLRPGMTATAEIVVGRSSMLRALLGSMGD